MESGSRTARLVLAGVLALAVWAVFAPATGFDFVLLDDATYVTDNPRVLRGLDADNVAWAFTTTRGENWFPLTWISLMVDAEVGGGDPHVYHRTNLLLHLACTLLLFHALTLLTGAVWRSWFVAALFAVHPLHVESVAWVAERKDVLSTLFWMLCLWLWARYVRRPSWPRNAAVAGALALGLLAKPMPVTVPFVLLVLDFWPLNRLRGRRRFPWIADARPFVEKIPLFVLVAVSSAITVWAQHRGPVEGLPLGERLAGVPVHYAWYLWKTFWPSGLATPYAVHEVSGMAVAASSALLLAITALAVASAARRPYLLSGWLWYLGTLVPVSGIVRVGLQTRADRFTYVPLIGIFLLLVWGIADLVGARGGGGQRRAWAAAAAGCVAIGVLGWLASRQVGYWRDSETLFSRALAVDDRNMLAHHGMGRTLEDRGEIDAALVHYREAVRLDAGAIAPRINLAGLLARRGEPEEAAEQYREAILLDPGNAFALTALGSVLNDLGHFDEAAARFREALAIDPNRVAAHRGLAVALARLGRTDEAVAHLRRVAELDPNDAGTRLTLGTVLMLQGRLDEAEAQLVEARRLDPGNPRAEAALGKLRRLRGP